MVSYLVALDPTFSFPFPFELFSVCLSFVYLETTFGSHRIVLARHFGLLLVFQVKWGVVYRGLFPCLFAFFFKTGTRSSDPGIYFFLCGVFKVCGLSEVFEFCHFFNSLLICLYVFTVCMVFHVFCLSFVYFKPNFRRSEFRLLKCFSISVVV